MRTFTKATVATVATEGAIACGKRCRNRTQQKRQRQQGGPEALKMHLQILFPLPIEHSRYAARESATRNNSTHRKKQKISSSASATQVWENNTIQAVKNPVNIEPPKKEGAQALSPYPSVFSRETRP